MEQPFNIETAVNAAVDQVVIEAATTKLIAKIKEQSPTSPASANLKKLRKEIKSVVEGLFSKKQVLDCF